MHSTVSMDVHQYESAGMNLLLDTHALVWWLTAEPMTADAIERIADTESLVVVSAASVWEIAIKRALGKLEFDGSLSDQVVAEGFTPLPISFPHAERAGVLPAHHRDQFDRLLIAQAQVEDLVLVTRDAALGAYDVGILAC